jgi:hypothetical protein
LDYAGIEQTDLASIFAHHQYLLLNGPDGPALITKYLADKL